MASTNQNIEQVNLGVSESFIFGKYPKATVTKAIKDRFSGQGYFRGITFKGGKFLVDVPKDLDDDSLMNELAGYEAIVYGELDDIINDGGIQDYMTEGQLERL